MRADGVECDRCGKRALCEPERGMPAGWGVARFSRAQPFTDSGNIDLCDDCWTQNYQRARKP